MRRAQQIQPRPHPTGMNQPIRRHLAGADLPSKAWRLLALALLALTGACGSPRASQTHPSPAASSAPAAQAAPAARTCTPSGPASASWLPADQQPAGRAGIVSAAVSGDTLTLTFAHGTPAFRTQPQSGATFSAGASGQPVKLAGSAGVHIALTGFRGDAANNAGPRSFTSGGELLREVREIADFEGTVEWAAGLATPGCASVEASGSILTFRFIPQPAPLLAVFEGAGPNVQASGVSLVTMDGRTVARATFAPRGAPYLGNVADMLQQPAQAGASGVYAMDGNGVVHLLRPSGAWETVATFPMTTDQHEAWFAVSPDGGRLLAGVLSAPKPGPPTGNGAPRPVLGTWRFDLEAATAGGQARVLRHQESDVWPNTPGSGVQTIFPVGWTEAGPVAMVGAPLFTQNVWPGGPLFTIDDGGRQTGRVGGDCTAASVLPSGLVPCTTTALKVTVRDASGNVRWQPALEGFSALALRLAPSGDAITNGAHVATASGSVALPSGFVAQGWLDSSTMVGRSQDGTLALVRLEAPGTAHSLGVQGDFAGVVQANG
jgi:hypothetical protein